MRNWNKREKPKPLTDKMGEKLLSLILYYQSRRLSVVIALGDHRGSDRCHLEKAEVTGVPRDLPYHSAILV